MMSIVPKFFLLLLLVLPATVLLTHREEVVAGGQGTQEKRDKIEDILEGEEGIDDEEDEEDMEVETEGDEEEEEEEEEEEVEEGDGTEAAKTEGEEEEGEQEEPLKASPDADTTFLFTKNSETEIPVTKVVQMLIGFANNGKEDFHIDNIQASLRYPQDFSYYIYNFTTQYYNTVVEPNKETTLEYVFNPSEVFASRPFGLVIELHYKDSQDEVYMDAVFNETVTLVELDEGLDTETFFLYIFLAAVLVLLAVGAHQLFYSFGKKRKATKPVVETGTSNHSGIDYDWIPKENIQQAKKTPSPRRSPRRRAKRTSGAGDD
ncbi:translocon-associated protein subunit alpha-like [Amphiura filiformis]|uniref:translocon-associated protein subunit alpha-like n=1 Tax=Amphiura filiformis TaxID=82378 RepID=UPI003B218D89